MKGNSGKEDAELGDKTMLKPPRQPRVRAVTTAFVTMQPEMTSTCLRPSPKACYGTALHEQDRLSWCILSHTRSSEKVNGV